MDHNPPMTAAERVDAAEKLLELVQIEEQTNGPIMAITKLLALALADELGPTGKTTKMSKEEAADAQAAFDRALQQVNQPDPRTDN